MGITMKECCVDCDAYTERAGKQDDSLYLDDAELSKFRQAIGLMTTIKGSMVMRPDDPIGMAQEVVEYVARLEKVAGDLNALIISAQETMTAYLVPDGIDADQAIERVIELLDGPRQREVQKAMYDALPKGGTNPCG